MSKSFIKLYCIRDAKAKRFVSPFSAENDQLAIRSFEGAMRQPGSLLHDFPADFALYYVGDFDTESGALVPNQVGSTPIVFGDSFVNVIKEA